MHSATEASLKKANLIETVQPSNDVAFGTYQGKRVIVDDGCPVDTKKGFILRICLERVRLPLEMVIRKDLCRQKWIAIREKDPEWIILLTAVRTFFIHVALRSQMKMWQNRKDHLVLSCPIR